MTEYKKIAATFIHLENFQNCNNYLDLKYRFLSGKVLDKTD